MISRHREAFAPGASTELRAQRNLRRQVSLLKGNLVTNMRTDTKGVGARVYQDGIYGFASAAELNDDAVRKVLKSATENAAFLAGHAGRGAEPLPAIRRGEGPRQPDFTDLPQKHYIDYLTELDEHIQKTYPNLESRTLITSSDSMEKLLTTSDGLSSHILAPRSYVYVFLSANAADGAPVEVFQPFGGRGTFDTRFTDPKDLHEPIDQLYQMLMQKREGVYARAGQHTVILAGELAGMLAHEAVGHTVEADLVLGGSVAGPMLNKQVASELVSMTDFAHSAFGETAPLPVYVDDEGVEAQDALLIDRGILKGYMHNRQSAQHFGMAPQGNARAWLFSDEPLIRMRNTAVHPGQDKLSDMIASVDDGYYLLHTGNGQADSTGEFMFGITMGYEIKQGKLGRAIRDTTISGVAFEMLKSVTMVSDQMSWNSSGFCGKKQMMPVGLGGPELKCRLTIGGK
ncbi:MAG: TldD/PmbA family protein [Clostridiales bacterium]|nr:TldD/PmbA family protein [Clostridiales bacterium]